MKNITKIFAAAAASLLAFSCTPHFPEAVKSEIPQIANVTPVVTVDQETNYVTFSIKEKGVVPMWLFGEEKVDGKKAKYVYTGNGISLRVRDAGTHTIELKAYNKNGVSQGSKEVTFTLENTYRDPFDPSPYMKALANTWAWDADNAGHFGCGPTVDDPTAWWSCDAHGKDGFGLYDDTMTFTAEGQFTHNPGEGGTLYVNWGSGFKTAGHEEEIASETDYQVEVEETTSAYTVENNWNDAGVEEVYVVLAEGQYLTYLPAAEALTTNTRYMFQNGLKAADIKKNPVLIWSNGGIAWKYSFVPFVKQATPMELLAGTDGKGKVWVMDFDTPGHMGCGASVGDPAGWWSAGPGEKSDTGLFDNEYTFYPDGTYEFNVGPDGVTYVNKDFTATGQEPAGEDYDLPWESFKTTFEFDGEEMTLPEGMILGYIPNNAAYENPHFVVTEITETKVVFVCDSDSGIAWQYIFKARDIVGPTETINGVAFEGGKADVSFKSGEPVVVEGIELGYIDPDFVTGNMTFAAPSGDYRVYNQNGFLKFVPLSGGDAATYPAAIWIIGEGAGKPEGGQSGWSTGEAVDFPFVKNGDTYTITLHCRANTNIKLFEQPNWGDDATGERVWLTNRYESFEGNGFFTMPDADGNIHAAAGLEEGWYVFTAVDTDGSGALALSVSKCYDIDGEANLYKSATINPELWYANGDWGQISNPEYEIGANNDFTATMPAGIGGSEWMGQNKLHTGVATSSDKIYDFCCTLEADEDCVVTIKLTGSPEGDGDPHAFFYDGNVKLEAGVPFTYMKAKISQKESNSDFTVIFDFGRVPEGKTVKATKICFQEHMEK